MEAQTLELNLFTYKYKTETIIMHNNIYKIKYLKNYVKKYNALYDINATSTLNLWAPSLAVSRQPANT